MNITLVKREQVVKEYTPIEKVLLDMFLPMTKFKYPGQIHLKEKMVRGFLNSSLLAMERTLRGPLTSVHGEAVPLEELVAVAQGQWDEHMKQFTTQAQALNHQRTASLRRNLDFHQTRHRATQDLQNAYKLVYFLAYGDTWEPGYKKVLTDQAGSQDYDCETAVKDYFKDIPEVVTSIQHGVQGGGKIAKSSAKGKR